MTKKERLYLGIITLLVASIIVESIFLFTMKYSEVQCHVDFEKLDNVVDTSIPYLSDSMTVGNARAMYTQMRMKPLTSYYIDALAQSVITCKREWKPVWGITK